MPYEYNNRLYEPLYQALCPDVKVDLLEAFGALLTITTDLIHCVEDVAEREKVLSAFIKALRATVAADEPYHVYLGAYLCPIDEAGTEEAALRKHCARIVHRLLIGDPKQAPSAPHQPRMIPRSEQGGPS